MCCFLVTQDRFEQAFVSEKLQLQQCKWERECVVSGVVKRLLRPRWQPCCVAAQSSTCSFLYIKSGEVATKP
jgi:hypothetical protein